MPRCGLVTRLIATSVRRAVVVVVVVVVAVASAGEARAWDDFGHMQVAATAYTRLTPAARARVAQLLKRNPRYPTWINGASKADRDRIAFLRAATWADAIKSDRAYKDDAQDGPTAAQNIGYADLFRHKYWHFVDQPFTPDGTATTPPAAPSLATQIPKLRAALCAPAANHGVSAGGGASSGDGDDVKSYDLVWLLHLVGDAHQPLHCVSRFDAADPTGDQGGNKVLITGNTSPPICDDPRFCPFGPPADLHAFLDDITGSTSCVAEVVASAAALPKPAGRNATILDETIWFDEGLALARGSVYVGAIGVGPGPFAIDPATQRAAVALGKQRIALAGARLANLLNDCVAKEAAAPN